MAWPICRSRSAPSHPVCAAGSRAIHERMAWITRMSARRVITVSPPGRSSLASVAMYRSVLAIHSRSGELHRINGDRPRQQLDEMPRRRVVEAHGAAHEGRQGAAAPARITSYRWLATSETRSKSFTPCRSRLAHQRMPLAVGHETEVAGM